ncbi:MAG TPA: cupin domain-containing protein [Gaiellaceae bacterium]|nr:cupin domain-containing protein [Gaiellaceae bacterium]
MDVVRVESLPDSGNSYRFDGADHAAPVSFFLLHTRPGEGPGLHRHPYVETFIVQEGQATFTVGGDTLEAHAGDIVVAPADVPHGFVNSGSEILRSVNIHPVAEMETVWL